MGDRDRLVGAPPAKVAPPEPDLPGPFAVGRYADELRGFLRGVARVRILGELTNFKLAGANAYFELRDASGAVPCAMWRTDLEKMGIAEELLRDGAEVVVAGGPDFYPGSGQSSPSFSFRATYLRPAGEGDLLAQLARLKRQLQSEGLFEPQKALPRPQLPRGIGVITGRGSAAAADLRAGFARRSWRGTIVWAHPPVQDRRAAPQVTRALQDLAALDEVEVIVVARGGGSLADLWAFCDETLCRTVALLPVPVISAIGHESDTTLIDDVAAVACSTPTHAAESAVRIDVAHARAELGAAASRVEARGRSAVRLRSEALREKARAPVVALRRERGRFRQMTRELRAASARGIAERGDVAARVALVLSRKSAATRTQTETERERLSRLGAALAARSGSADRERRRRLEVVATTIRAHEPERVLERGFALVEDRGSGDPLTTAERAREAEDVRVRFADAAVDAKIEED